MSATLDKIKEEMRTLAPEELQEVRELADSLLSEPPSPAELLDCTPERRWLAEHGHEYAGQWVALDGDRLLAHGEEAREVYDAAHEAGVSLPLVVRVNPPDQLPFGGW
jgi:hypothetical protein